MNETFLSLVACIKFTLSDMKLESPFFSWRRKCRCVGFSEAGGLPSDALCGRIPARSLMLRKWHLKKRWIFWLAVGLALGSIVIAVAAYEFLRVPTLPLQAGVIERTSKVRLTGKVVAVDFYLPMGTGPAPVVVVAHGFTRNRKTMAGWGGMLAKAGFIAVVPDLPTWADHARNGRALVELLDAVLAAKFFQQPKPSGGLRWWDFRRAVCLRCWRPWATETSHVGSVLTR